MTNFFFILFIAAMIATLGALIIGLAAMIKGGEFNKKYGNKMMQARVMLQGLAILLFVLAFATK